MNKALGVSVGMSVLVFSLSLFLFHPPTLFADTNLVSNPSVETPNPSNTNQPQAWTTDLWGTTKATFTYPTTGHSGTRSVQTQITKKGTGDAKWYFTEVPVTPGQTYFFSDWYQSSVASQITVQYHLKSGSYQYLDLKAPAAAASWQQFQGSFVPPTNTTAVTVFHLISAVGTLSVDDYSLTTTVGTSTPPPPPPSPVPFAFSLSNSGNKSAAQGGTATSSITATLATGTPQSVSFGVSGLPAGITSGFSASSCTPTCTTILTLHIATSTATGTVPINITGAAGTTTSTTSFNLTVTAATSTPLPPPPPPPSGNNIVPNPSFENQQTANANLPISWQNDKWGNNTTTFTYNKNLGHTGTHSVTAAMSAYKTGDAKWDLTTPLPVTPGDTYDFSDWYQSSEVSHVVIEFNLTNGTQYYIEMRTAPVSAGWNKYEQAFQIPFNATSMRVFHMIEGVGSVTVDDASLVKITPKGFTRPLVTLTYDNGFEDNISTAIPMMNAAGIPATYCISTQYVEGIPAQESIVKQIAADGYEICSHAVDHDNGDMTLETVSQIDFELSHSQSYLQALVGQPIHNFLTPFGAYNDTVVNEIKKYYRAHRTTDEGYNTVENFDQYRLLVQNMEPGTALPQFQSWLDEAKKTNSWLILVYHRVATSSLSDYDTPLADFQPQLNAIKSSGITVKTFDQALDEVLPQVGL